MDDKEILALLRKNPEKGIEAALTKYGGIVKTITVRVLYNSQEDAEECIADTFLAMWKKSASLKNINLRAWLIVTARNTAIDRYRKLKKNMELEIDENIPSDTNLSEEIEVNQLIDELTYPDKEIFIRKYYFLETSAEIAATLGLTESDVNTRLSRGRKKMKIRIINQGGLYEY